MNIEMLTWRKIVQVCIQGTSFDLAGVPFTGLNEVFLVIN